MTRNILFPLILFMLCQFAVSAQSNNRFVEMSQLPKIEYQHALNGYLDLAPFFDVEKLNREIKQLNEFNVDCKNDEWKDIAKLLHIILDAKFLTKDSIKVNFNIHDIHVRFLRLYNETESEYVRWKTLQLIAHLCWYELQNFESAFEHSLHLCKSIENLSDSCFLDKLTCYVKLADRYYYFKEYDKAIFWHNKVANITDNLHPYNQKDIVAAYNGLGVCYRQKGDLEMSDIYFNKIITFISTSSSNWNSRLSTLWEGIAQGNLGDNLYLKGKYDEAIPLLNLSLNNMVKEYDFAYASGTAITLADIYLKKGIFDRAYYYGNLAYDYEHLLTRSGRLESIYFFFNKYYTATHNAKKALLYLDSAVNEQAKNDALYSANKLLRVEQRANLLEQQAKDKDIAIAQKQASIYLRNFVFIAIFSLLILLLLFFLFNLYRKKQSAYQALVIKSQQWANVRKEEVKEQLPETDKIEDTTNNVKDIEIVSLMEMVYQMFEQQQIYKDSNLSIQSMAELLKTNRNYLSKAINSVTGNNFNTFINEYRIKEAIKLLSNPKFDYLSTDLLAEKVGFANRFTFSAAFKKHVGITSAEFKRNREKQIQPDNSSKDEKNSINE